MQFYIFSDGRLTEEPYTLTKAQSGTVQVDFALIEMLSALIVVPVPVKYSWKYGHCDWEAWLCLILKLKPVIFNILLIQIVTQS